MKQHMAKHCDFTFKGLHKDLERAWTKVTSRTMRGGIMKKVTYWQDYHFEQDRLLDTVDDKHKPLKILGLKNFRTKTR